jgi:hypothetical protein
MASSVEGSIVVTDKLVTIRRKGSSSSVVAHILGKTGTGASEKIYLDRLVHAPYEDQIGPFAVSGAVSSIFSKPV